MDNKTKSKAIAFLKMSKPISEISETLDIPEPIILEWEQELEYSDLEEQSTNALALKQTVDLVSQDLTTDDYEKNSELLQIKLLNVGLLITDNIKHTISNPEAAKTLNLCSNTIANLQNAFFKNGMSLSIINQNNNSLDGLELFRNSMKA